MNSQQIRKMVTTAIIIALAIAFQLLLLTGGGLTVTYIVGSLVNLCLIVAACCVGPISGVVVSVITPLIALLFGHAQLPMVPWVMAGNAVLALIFAFFAQKDKSSLAVEWVRWIIVAIVAAAIKYLVMSFGQSMVLTSAKGLAFNVAFATAAAAQTVQIITAIIGAVLGGIVIPALPANVVGKSVK